MKVNVGTVEDGTAGMVNITMSVDEALSFLEGLEGLIGCPPEGPVNVMKELWKVRFDLERAKAKAA